MKYFIAFLCFSIYTCSLVGQKTIRLTNPSFEGEARIGRYDPRTKSQSPQIEGWYDCGKKLFPHASPPDLHSATSYFWENPKRSIPDGKTYLGLMVREDDSYESIGQQLSSPLKEGQSYEFSISLAQSTRYSSHTLNNQTHKSNFIESCVLRILGGNDLCETVELLAKSPPIDHEEWKVYNFIVKPKSDISYITLEAFFKVPVLFGYNGNLLLDHASDFVLFDETSNNKPNHIRTEYKLINRTDKAKKSALQITTKKLEVELNNPEKLLVNYYTEGRNYGLYRFAHSLSTSNKKALLALLNSENLDTKALEAAIKLSDLINSEGHSEETKLKRKTFDSNTTWQKEIKAYLLERDLIK